MAGDAHIVHGFESRNDRRMEVERDVRATGLEPVDASPERFLRILRANALEQGDDFLRLAPARCRKPNLRGRTVERVEIAHHRLLFLHTRVTRKPRPA